MIKSATLSFFDLLPARLKNALFHLSFNIARPEFKRFATLYAHAPDVEMGLRALSLRGMSPATVIDVGAFRGEYTTMARAIWPSAKVEMFEPNINDKVASAAATSGARLHGELLGAEDGKQVDFNVMGSGSSVLSERSPLPRTVEIRELRRLDSVLPEVAGPAFLKIDAQGYELEVLRGATKILPAVEYIHLEIALIEINEGAPLLADVIAFLDGLGFAACEVLEIHRRPLDKALNQIDFLFCRKDSHLFADKRHFA